MLSHVGGYGSFPRLQTCVYNFLLEKLFLLEKKLKEREISPAMLPSSQMFGKLLKILAETRNLSVFQIEVLAESLGTKNPMANKQPSSCS